MPAPRKPLPVSWSELRVLLLLGSLVVLGVVANAQSLHGFLVALGFGAIVLRVAWLAQQTLQEGQGKPPPSLWKVLWDAGSLLALVALWAALLYWR